MSKILTILIFSSFFVLRLYGLGTHDFWYDEIGTLNYATYPWHNWNAPLYWIVMHFWTKVFGVSEFFLRLPSAIFSFLSVILTFLLGRDLFNKKVGFVAAILIGLSAFQLWYAQEARDYSMVLFLGLFSTWLLYKALRENKFKLWVSFILVSLCGIYTNYFCLLLVISQFFYIILSGRSRIGFRAGLCFLFIATAFMPYLPHFLAKFFVVWQGFWVPKPSVRSLLITLENFSLGYSGSGFLYLISDILAGICLISGLTRIFNKETRGKVVLCLSLVFLPITLAYIFSKIFFSVYLDRGLIIFSPYYYIILSVGIAGLSRKVSTGLLILFVFLLLICGYRYFKDKIFMPIEHHYGTYIKRPVRPLVKFILENAKPQDAVAFTNESAMPSFFYYDGTKSDADFYYFFDPSILDTSWRLPVCESKFNIPLTKISSLKTDKIWLIFSNWARDGELDENSISVKKWCDRNFKAVLKQEIDGLWVYAYVKGK